MHQNSQDLIYRASSAQDAIQATSHGIPIVVAKLGSHPDDLRRFAQQLSTIFKRDRFSDIDVIQAVPNANERSIRLSLDAHPLHTDGAFEPTPPRRFLLQFAETDPEAGGTSLFLSIPDLLNAMPSQYRHLLLKEAVLFQHINLDGTLTEYQTLALYHAPDDGRLTMRYSGDRQVSMLPMGQRQEQVKTALDWIHTYVQITPASTYQAEAGDILVVDNLAVIHGRTALSQNSYRRCLRRIYLECPTYLTGLEKGNFFKSDYPLPLAN